jgi:hypothetical protein
MKNRVLLIAFFITTVGCGRSSNKRPEQREMFDAGHQEVIACWANQSEETMSILFGNNAAIEAMQVGISKHQAGEVYTLVKWHQLANPHWYGSNINGRIKIVETVKFSHSPSGVVVPKYTLFNEIAGIPDKNVYDEKRINFIVNQKPSLFP